MEKTEKIYTFRIPVELLVELHRLASAQDLRVNQLIRRTLRDMVEKANDAQRYR